MSKNPIIMAALTQPVEVTEAPKKRKPKPLASDIAKAMDAEKGVRGKNYVRFKTAEEAKTVKEVRVNIDRIQNVGHARNRPPIIVKKNGVETYLSSVKIVGEIELIEANGPRVCGMSTKRVFIRTSDAIVGVDETGTKVLL